MTRMIGSASAAEWGGSEARLDRRSRVVGRLLLAALTFGLLLTLARVAQLQVSPPQHLLAGAKDRLGARDEPTVRGALLDRRGRPMAVGRLGRRLFVDPARFPKPYDRSIVRLAEASGIDADRIGSRVLSRIARNEGRRGRGERLIRYASIGGVLPDARVEVVRALDMPGVHLETRGVREIAAEELAAPVVGFVGVDGEGLLGAERAHNAALRSSPGGLSYVRDARGRALWVEAGGYTPPRPGESVRLTIDLTLQKIARDQLRRGVLEADAAGGRAVIFDPARGEILALTSVIRRPPDAVPFDADLLERDGSAPRFLVVPPDKWRERRPELARVRCIEEVYEPGSTFKPFMWAAVTDLGLAEPDEVIDTHGGAWRTPYGRTLRDVTARDEQTWEKVLVNSSNIGMAQTAARMSHEQMRNAVRRFGFGEETGVDLPGEAAGLVTPASRWTEYTQTSVAMGYEVAVTTVQMVRAFSAFARRGELAGSLPAARLRVGRHREPQDHLIYRVIDPSVARRTRDALRQVADRMDERLERAGVLDQPPRYPMFGKSGTANIARPDGKGYLERQYVSSFIAAAPAEKPRIVALVVIDDPGPGRVERRRHYGSWTAGPVVRRIVDRSLMYLGVASQREW